MSLIEEIWADIVALPTRDLLWCLAGGSAAFVPPATGSAVGG
ncbi:MAG: hypothetical protein WD470_07470 [Rhodospirillaceae bacterium]